MSLAPHRVQVICMARWRWLLSAALAASAISSAATVQAQEGNQNNDVPASLDEIPGPARDEIMREVGTGWLMGVEKGTWHGEPSYVGRITKGSRIVTIRVDAEGNIMERHLITMADD
jgi:hypothetical protein